MKYRSIEKPERIKKLPHFKNLPIPYTTLIDADGRPQFKAIDSDKVWEVKRDGKCSVCGDSLDYWIAFMVTEQEAESRVVYENPNHEECLRYAFNVCPWLYYANAKYSDASKSKIEGYETVSAHPERDESENRPRKLGIYITNGYKNIILPSRFRVCKVGKAKRLEWIDGQ